MSKTSRSSEREQLWREIILGWKQSGQSVREYCRIRGVTEPNFYAWRRSLAEREHQRAKSLVPVRVVADSMIEVVWPSGVTVRIPVGVPAAMVGELLAALGWSC